MSRRPTAPAGEPVAPARGVAYLFPTKGGAFGVVRVIREVNAADGLGRRSYVLAALSAWSGDEAPRDLSDPKLREVLTLTHPPFDAEPHARRGWVLGRPPRAFRFLGHLYPAHEEERGLCSSHCNWSWFPRDLEAELAWRRDRDGYVAARAAKRARRAKTPAPVAAPTLAELARAEPLARWRRRPAKSVASAREVVARCAGALEALPPAKRRARVLALVEAAVGELNRLNGQRMFIETEEREDLCRLFADLARACGHEGLGDFTLPWREW